VRQGGGEYLVKSQVQIQDLQVCRRDRRKMLGGEAPTDASLAAQCHLACQACRLFQF
jgi:hypothetical protein